MAPGSVNNAMRAMMADSRKWQLDWSGVTTAGSSNAYTMTCNQGITAYADGMRFSFRADRNNTGAATLNIDARGAKALRKVSGGSLVALVANDIVAKAIYDVVFNSADDVFVITGNDATRYRQLAQGSLSGAELVIEIPTDIEAVAIEFWRFVPSTVGEPLRLQVGSGTIGSPVWGANHTEQGFTSATGSPTYYSLTGLSSLEVSFAQIATGSSHGILELTGFHSSGAVQGASRGLGEFAGPTRGFFTSGISEDSAVVHTLVKLSVSAGTMAGKYRIMGYRKP
jgi:hypothetical protein